MNVVFPNMFLFGFMAIIVLAVVAGVWLSRGGRRASMGFDRRECPACKETMRRDAGICPHCRTPSEPWTFHDNRWWVVRNDASYYLDEPSQTWVQSEPTGPPQHQG